MPMNLTVTRNRKTSRNYNSEGYGVSLTVELDQSLLNRPAELQDRISQLYREADVALDQQAAAGTQTRSTQPARNANRGNGPPGGGGRPAPMTNSQRRAIDAIGQRLGLDVEAECRDLLRLALSGLSIREASRFIDHLKALERPAAAGGNGAQGRNGGGR